MCLTYIPRAPNIWITVPHSDRMYPVPCNYYTGTQCHFRTQVPHACTKTQALCTLRPGTDWSNDSILSSVPRRVGLASCVTDTPVMSVTILESPQENMARGHQTKSKVFLLSSWGLSWWMDRLRARTMFAKGQRIYRAYYGPMRRVQQAPRCKHHTKQPLFTWI